MAGEFLKSIKRREVLTLSFGAMIGWSWVLLTGDWLIRAGTLGTALAFVIGGIAIIFISLTYAELAAAMPNVGGEHVYTFRALGFTASFITSWAIVMAYVTVCVFESAALPTALGYLFPDLKQGYLYQVQGADVHASMVAIGIAGAVALTVINFLGIRFAAFVQTLVTGGVIIVGLLFLAGAFTHDLQGASVPMLNHGVSGILAVLIMVPALMVGFDVIPQSAEEIDLPPQQIGAMLVLSVVLAVIWYVSITFAVGLSLSIEDLGNTSIATADAMRAAWGSDAAGAVMVLAGVGGILTSWNAFIIGGSRVIYALSEAGMIPKVFSRLHPRYNTPYVAILAIGILSCISPFFGRAILVWLVNAGSFMVVIAYGFVAFAFIRLRQLEPDMPRPFRVPGGTIVGWLALSMAFLLGLLYTPLAPSGLVWPYEWAFVLGGALVGLVFYLQAVVRRSI
ncbi:MAG: APA family basic amino acid/polyamine antiporter [Candidatus Azotimanducaceae bacterium]